MAEVSELWSLIQSHLDQYGVTDAEFARRMGVSPQTLNSWKKRGVRKLPDRDKLESVSELTRNTYAHVLDAALVDSGYKDELRDELVEIGQRIRDLDDPGSWDALRDLVAELLDAYYLEAAERRPKLSELIGSGPRRTTVAPAAPADATYPPRALEKTKSGRIAHPANETERLSLLEFYGFTPDRLDLYNLGDGKVLTGFLMTVHTDALKREQPDLWAKAITPGFDEQLKAAGAASVRGIRYLAAPAWVRRALARAGWVAPTLLSSPRPTPSAVAEAEKHLRYDPDAAAEYIELTDAVGVQEQEPIHEQVHSADQPAAAASARTEVAEDQASAREKTWVVFSTTIRPGGTPAIASDEVTAPSYRQVLNHLEEELKARGWDIAREDGQDAGYDLLAVDDDGTPTFYDVKHPVPAEKRVARNNLLILWTPDGWDRVAGAVDDIVERRQRRAATGGGPAPTPREVENVLVEADQIKRSFVEEASTVDLTNVDAPPDLVKAVDLYAAQIRYIDPPQAPREPFIIARAIAAPFRNGAQVTATIDRIESDVPWDRPGAVAGTLSAFPAMLEAARNALIALDHASQRALNLAATREMGQRLRTTRTSQIGDGSDAYRLTGVDVSIPTPWVELPADLGETLAASAPQDPRQSDYAGAARDLGDEPVGRKLRRRQDEAGELPDPEGPEGGA
ncbi:hypothetical protein ACXYTP_19110 [Tsukamurella ocularis]|uniref:hypothetical protein n=1 Tax=Tsukamurella ocularis TaxID=1970234 RepID=UPI0039EEA9BA